MNIHFLCDDWMSRKLCKLNVLNERGNPKVNRNASRSTVNRDTLFRILGIGTKASFYRFI